MQILGQQRVTGGNGILMFKVQVHETITGYTFYHYCMRDHEPNEWHLNCLFYVNRFFVSDKIKWVASRQVRQQSPQAICEIYMILYLDNGRCIHLENIYQFNI